MTLPFLILFVGLTHASVLITDGKCQIVINTSDSAEAAALRLNGREVVEATVVFC